MESLIPITCCLMCYLIGIYTGINIKRKLKSDKSELNKRDVSGQIKDLIPIEKPIGMMSDGSIHEKLYGVKNAWEGVRVEDCSPEECKRKLLVQDGDLTGLLELENDECEKAMNNLKEKIEESNSKKDEEK